MPQPELLGALVVTQGTSVALPTLRRQAESDKAMTHSMRVDLQCPLCDDGTLIATVSPGSIDDLEDQGCGHAEQVWNQMDSRLADTIWRAVADEEQGRYEDAQESRYAAWRDR